MAPLISFCGSSVRYSEARPTLIPSMQMGGISVKRPFARKKYDWKMQFAIYYAPQFIPTSALPIINISGYFKGCANPSSAAPTNIKPWLKRRPFRLQLRETSYYDLRDELKEPTRLCTYLPKKSATTPQLKAPSIPAQTYTDTVDAQRMWRCSSDMATSLCCLYVEL